MAGTAKNATINAVASATPKVVNPRPSKRRRRSGLDVEIRREAERIMQQRSEDAYKAAALMVCNRKLDEIKAILNAAGIAVGAAPSGYPQVMASVAQPAAVPQAVENPCCQCGRPGVRRTRPNAFNPTGSWYCAAHQVLAARSEFEDAVDRQLIGQAAPTTQRKPVLVQTQTPAVMRPQVEQPAPPAPEPAPEPQPAEPPADPLKAAMNALGV